VTDEKTSYSIELSLHSLSGFRALPVFARGLEGLSSRPDGPPDPVATGGTRREQGDAYLAMFETIMGQMLAALRQGEFLAALDAVAEDIDFRS